MTSQVCDERHCPQPVDRDSTACYYHAKLRDRLIRRERFEFATTSRIGRPMAARWRSTYLEALSAPERP